jgi:hypothetical protein
LTNICYLNYNSTNRIKFKLPEGEQQMNTLVPVIPDADDNSLTLPLIVAQKWSFPLAHTQTDEGTFYAVQDWIRGLTGDKEVKKILANMRTQKSFSNRPLPYVATDGKTYQRDFTNDKGLYLIAQYLRVTKARPVLDEIKRYLAAAGAFADAVRRSADTIVMSGAVTPDQALEAAIVAYRAQGKDDKWIQARMEGKIKRHIFTSALTAAVREMLTPRHYALATDDVYKGLWGRAAAYLRHEMELPKTANLRDHQPALALDYQRIAEGVAAQQLGEREELSWGEAREIVQTVAAFIGRQAQETGQLMRMDLATGRTLLK